MFLLVLQKNLYPQSASDYEFQHNGDTEMENLYLQVVTDKKSDILSFINKIPYTFNPEKLPSCNTYCKLFTAQLDLKPLDFFVYQAFISSILDPMLAAFPQEINTFFGISLKVNQNLPFNALFTDVLRNLTVKITSNSANAYSALSIAGFEGFFALHHKNAKQYVSATVDQNCTDFLPKFDEYIFIKEVENQIQNQFINFQKHLLQYTLLCQNDIIPGDLITYITQNQTAIYSQKYIFLVGNFIGDSKFISSNDAYLRQIIDFSVQSSCKANLDNIISSDFRMVQVERNGKSKQISALQQFQDAIQTFPFRDSETFIISSLGANENIFDIVKCNDVYDGKIVVQCADLPPQESPTAIVFSIFIMIVTIVAWVYGCLVSYRMNKVIE
ncbi:hypothetical protein SS50377_21897 [Spironucleus salmonicida]|uniref:Transmembrane protein n=1 Tax=Spironucleus salmonicida TaxID=348837 RepID=V6LJA1_9EUKA|nr:hypothetical protein SS50377_21897 [Spironucleus salmonicida]|eukprot:EST44438.1 hypothetical protein SS50377_15746 [Spironucleus salmonicida]